MNRKIACQWATTALLLLAASEASAVAVAGPEGTAVQGRRIVFAAPATAAAPADNKPLELSAGQIESVNLGKSELVIAGKVIALHPGRLRVIGANGQVQSSAVDLRKGMNVRFALDPASKAVERPIVLVYIEK